MLFQLDQLDQAIDCLSSFFSRTTTNLQSVRDVFLDRHSGKQRVCLKDHAHTTLACRQISYVLAVQDDAPTVRLFKAGDDAQNRCLAAARGAQQDK